MPATGKPESMDKLQESLSIDYGIPEELDIETPLTIVRWR